MAKRSNEQRSGKLRSVLPRAISAHALDQLKGRTQAGEAGADRQIVFVAVLMEAPSPLASLLSTASATWSSSGFGQQADVRSDQNRLTDNNEQVLFQ